ncbi:MAG TPA: plastocyanin/azurin family copper-binding protein, partial [Chryseosolibacter sp.]
ASGHNFYNARSYPEKFWNRTAFVTEPTGHLVHVARIEEDGAGFIEKDGWNLFASADEWVAPVEAKVGPDGAVWILDWYNFIVQHNPTPSPERGGYKAVNGPGNAYENPLRDQTRGRIWRVVYREAPPYKAFQLDRDDPDELVAALSDDNQFWRMTAQRLLVETRNVEVLPSLYKLIRNEETDQNGERYPATHALWVLDGLGVIQSGNEAFKVVSGALKHPAPGVRKAAIEILSSIQWTDQAILESGILDDPDPNTRLTAILSLVKVSPSAALGEKLFSISNEEKIKSDNWLSKAVYIAATRHRKSFTEAFLKTNPDFQVVKLNTKRESETFNDNLWKTMTLPQSIEEAGLDIDGVVWFRKVVHLPTSAEGKKGKISIGPVDDSDETWINGVKVGGLKNQYAIPRTYDIPARVLKPGNNIIAIRMDDTGSRGGVYGKAEQMFLTTDNVRIPLAGEWRYDVEKQYNSTNNTSIFKNTSIAELLVRTYFDKTDLAGKNETSVSSAAEDTKVIRIRSLVNEMKYDLNTFTVEAGQSVEIIFENPDFMQHNLVILQPGAMEEVGRAADKLAADAKGASMHYVPELPQVLYHTPLVNPQETVRLEFIAPEKPGDYPYVCTFPGHWSIMNGIMKVVKSNPSL